MDTIKCRSTPNNKGSSKLASTFQKVINLKTGTRIASNNGIGICMLTQPTKFHQDLDSTVNNKDFKAKHRAVLDALIAKIFASLTTIKAAYAELQMAQNPYCSDAIQAADQNVVDELKQLSELKRSFLKNDLDHLSPQVTLMLAQIQEQQSLMKTYGITIKKLQNDFDAKELDVSCLKSQLDESLAFNKSLQKRVNASGPVSTFDNIRFSALNMSHFVQFLHSTLRSMRSFVRFLVREMEVAHWDLDAATKAIEPEVVLAKSGHRVFLFESFVCKTMFDGFNYPNFMLPNLSPPPPSMENPSREHFFRRFKKLISVNPKHYLTQNPASSFAGFTRDKYLQLVHAKMECSLFRNLNQRKLVDSGGFPDTAFFTVFAEMARRIWSLNLLAFSFGQDVSIFQVQKDCRFSEVYMESVATDESLQESPGIDPHLRVGFTVVPGFKIGQTIVQSRVYLSPAVSPISS